MTILIILIAIIIPLYTLFVYRGSGSKNIEKETINKIIEENENKDKVVQSKNQEERQEQTYLLGTHNIKYKIFDEHNLNYNLSVLHKNFSLKNLWIQEPYYTAFYKLLSFLNRDILFIKDSDGKIFLLNVRDEDGKEITTKAYNVVSILDIVSRILMTNKEMILQYSTKDAQKIVLAVLIYCISKSEQFRTVDIENIYSIFLQDYPLKRDILYIVSIFEKEDSQLYFIPKSFKNAIKYCYKHPYTEIKKDEQNHDIKLIPQLPKKILRHI